MIPRDYITEWRTLAPWIDDSQVEQDLVIGRALVEIFSHPVLAASLAFRGGTALYKLYLTPPARYSEDIDLVQITPGPAGSSMDTSRSVLDPWLGEAHWKQSRGRVTFGYRVRSEGIPATPPVAKLSNRSNDHSTGIHVTTVELFCLEHGRIKSVSHHDDRIFESHHNLWHIWSGQCSNLECSEVKRVIVPQSGDDS